LSIFLNSSLHANAWTFIWLYSSGTCTWCTMYLYLYYVVLDPSLEASAPSGGWQHWRECEPWRDLAVQWFT